MLEILLDYIKSNRGGNWQSHLESFEAKRPWLTVYNHTNYVRWGPVSLAEMKNLHSEVSEEFETGNFVVKRSQHRFNQVPLDQAI